MKKRGMTEFLKNFLFILGIFFAVFFVVVIVYNISQIEGKVITSIDIKIDKQSVKLDDNKLSFDVKGTENIKELEQIKFILYDGEKLEEVIFNTTDLKKQGVQSYSINFKNLGFLELKTISVVPGIKVKGEIKFLSVSDRIKVTETGGVESEEFVCGNGILEGDEKCDDGNTISGDGCSSTCRLELLDEEITSCSDCGGILGCSRQKCHAILIGTTKCYYLGGVAKKCSSCSVMSCESYKSQEDCGEDRCSLTHCTWSSGKCVTNPDCGDGYVDSSKGETCEPPESQCTPDYLGECTYCGSGCNYVTLQGGYCGDGLLNGEEECDDGEDNTDTPCTPVYGGSCSYCDVSCKSYSVAGASCGDGECSAELGETCSSCVADCACSDNGCCLSGICLSSGTCSGEKICSIGDLINHCGDGTCNCGETCSSCEVDCKKCNGLVCDGDGSDCYSGNCVDGVCCSTSACSTCKSCNLNGFGTCSNDPLGTSCGVDSECDGSGNCISTLTEDGGSCGDGEDCQSGNCVDSVCCSDPSCSTCYSCNIAGHLGTCYFDDEGTACAGGECDGAGNCESTLTEDGGSCDLGTECQSTYCVDGVCCSTSSCSTCKSCNLNGLGTCSNDPEGTACAGGECDGAGNCESTLKENGETCTLGSECFSGYCYVDVDNDRYAPSSGTKTCRSSVQLSGVDCNDNCATCYPSSSSTTASPDGLDQNCDGYVDNEDYSYCTPPNCYFEGQTYDLFASSSACSSACSTFCSGYTAYGGTQHCYGSAMLSTTCNGFIRYKVSSGCCSSSPGCGENDLGDFYSCNCRSSPFYR